VIHVQSIEREVTYSQLGFEGIMNGEGGKPAEKSHCENQLSKGYCEAPTRKSGGVFRLCEACR